MLVSQNKEIEEVVHCIRSHGPRGLEEPGTLEAKVSYDVNVLSCSVGYIGVARVFDYFMREGGMNVKQMIEIPAERKDRGRISIPKLEGNLVKKGLKEQTNFGKNCNESLLKKRDL